MTPREPHETARPLVFISWGGDASKSVAAALRDLISNTIQTVVPWMSESDIEKGARWRSEIEKQLDEAAIGIIALTEDSATRPWLLFEAGALSKKNDRVYTYLYGIAHVSDPLAQFQKTKFDKIDTLKMLKSINHKLGPNAIEETRLITAFGHNWPNFEGAMGSVASTAPAKQKAPSVEEVLTELLTYVREQSREMVSLQVTLSNLRYEIEHIPHALRAVQSEVQQRPDIWKLLGLPPGKNLTLQDLAKGISEKKE